MFPSLLQIRAEEIQREWLAEAAQRRLAREVVGRPTGLLARIAARFSRSGGRHPQPSEASASATRRTPDSISDVVAVPYPKTSPPGARVASL
jgi:hypothetical protein